MTINEIILSVLKKNINSSNTEIADKLRDNYKDIKLKRETLRKKISLLRLEHNIKPNLTLSSKDEKIKIEKEFEGDRKLITITKDKGVLKQKYDLAVKNIDKLENLLDLKKTVDNEKVRTINFAHIGKDESNEATAITLFSDIHFEERVDKNKVNGINEYNPIISEERCINYFINLRKRIDKERRDIIIDNLIFASLGDMIHGFIHEEYLSSNYMQPIPASFKMYEIVLNGLKYLLEDKKIKKIKFIGKVGNHSRTTFKPYTQDEALMSNEWGIYKHLEKHFEHEERIDFILDESYYTYLTVYGKVLRFHHGHNVKYGGGIGGLTIPLIKSIYRANMQKKADMDFIGHFHSRFNLPFCSVNGSIVGFNAYGIKIGAEPQEPVQQFHLLDSKRGFTSNSPIFTT